jgi:hypothetical protein
MVERRTEYVRQDPVREPAPARGERP